MENGGKNAFVGLFGWEGKLGGGDFGGASWAHQKPISPNLGRKWEREGIDGKTPKLPLPFVIMLPPLCTIMLMLVLFFLIQW